MTLSLRSDANDRTDRKKIGGNGISMISSEAKILGEPMTNQVIKDILSGLRAALKRADLWDSLDYFKISTAMQGKEEAPFPRFNWLSCAPVSSGGQHYIYIGTVFNGRHRLVFVGKTSKGFESACAVANRCARELGA